MNVTYDCETYKNVFILCAQVCDSPFRYYFEISEWRNDSRQLIEWVRTLDTMYGFNNLGFDYPVLHTLIRMGKSDAYTVYEKAQQIIQSEDRFANMIYPSDRVVKQIDLFKIHHFDNKARTTNLKALEFNMRMDNISDLPFPVGSSLTQEQVAVLRDYCFHDVAATEQFRLASLDQIRFREELTRKHGRDFMNHNDTKIGAEIFQMELEKVGVQCYDYGANGRQPRQTERDFIPLKECVPQWINFNIPEFQRIKEFFSSQNVTETKGVFKDVVARVGGIDFAYGSGGLHASVENKSFIADDDWMIYDVDVTSLYPSIAIEHGHYPEHLGPRFVEVYHDLRTQRIGYKKGSAENAMLKLALNGVYGKSNDKFSIFYDPFFTMKITLGGQMMISLLAERLLSVPDLHIIQVNTDGITVKMKRAVKPAVDAVCQQWEQETRLTLESVEYSKMVIRDVNNYIALKTNGEVKRKGCYEWNTLWHQDASALIVPKVAEQVLIYDKPLRQTVMEWPDRMDFMQRIKVPRNGFLRWGDDTVQNTTRYYVSVGGKPLVKWLPPTAKKPDQWRSFSVESGWTVQVCNDIKDAVLPINIEYYCQEIEKLVLGVM
jgi:hypothetical protein